MALGGTVSAVRHSTLGGDLMVAAVPAWDGNTVVGAVRAPPRWPRCVRTCTGPGPAWSRSGWPYPGRARARVVVGTSLARPVEALTRRRPPGRGRPGRPRHPEGPRRSPRSRRRSTGWPEPARRACVPSATSWRMRRTSCERRSRDCGSAWRPCRRRAARPAKKPAKRWRRSTGCPPWSRTFSACRAQRRPADRASRHGPGRGGQGRGGALGARGRPVGDDAPRRGPVPRRRRGVAQRTSRRCWTT